MTYTFPIELNYNYVARALDLGASGIMTPMVNTPDDVLKIIRSSKSPDEAKNQLLKTKWKISKTTKLIKLIENKNISGSYSLSQSQVISILELRLQKLTALGI